ncbi:hypothetical protein [Nocardia sp. CY41]|uniref:hypothetical protein n=1 Tax=Nocardia sp. CY41 TaxID=2608686 RepID=UPI001358E5B7|nr:hypothetical protein [Nocardia sp. CY41]
MSIRTWKDGLSRLDIEQDPSGRIRFGLHGINQAGEVIEYGFVASFSASAREEIAQFIKEGM